MGKINRFAKINNFLNNFECTLLKDYCRIFHRLNQNQFDKENDQNLDTYVYGDPIMESLLINKKKDVEKELGFEIFPTFSSWKMHTLNSNMSFKKHKNSCEISVMINLGNDGTAWPLKFENQEHNLNVGDALIFLPKNFYYDREEFKGDWYAQTFLYYVKKNGDYKNLIMDGRKYWGVQK